MLFAANVNYLSNYWNLLEVTRIDRLSKGTMDAVRVGFPGEVNQWSVIHAAMEPLDCALVYMQAMGYWAESHLGDVDLVFVLREASEVLTHVQVGLGALRARANGLELGIPRLDWTATIEVLNRLEDECCSCYEMGSNDQAQPALAQAAMVSRWLAFICGYMARVVGKGPWILSKTGERASQQELPNLHHLARFPCMLKLNNFVDSEDRGVLWLSGGVNVSGDSGHSEARLFALEGRGFRMALLVYEKLNRHYPRHSLVLEMDWRDGGVCLVAQLVDTLEENCCSLQTFLSSDLEIKRHVLMGAGGNQRACVHFNEAGAAFAVTSVLPRLSWVCP